MQQKQVNIAPEIQDQIVSGEIDIILDTMVETHNAWTEQQKRLNGSEKKKTEKDVIMEGKMTFCVCGDCRGNSTSASPNLVHTLKKYVLLNFIFPTHA